MENQIKEALAKYEALIREQLARNEKIKSQKSLYNRIPLCESKIFDI